jgi:hypothetical protein
VSVTLCAGSVADVGRFAPDPVVGAGGKTWPGPRGPRSRAQAAKVLGAVIRRPPGCTRAARLAGDEQRPGPAGAPHGQHPALSSSGADVRESARTTTTAGRLAPVEMPSTEIFAA